MCWQCISSPDNYLLGAELIDEIKTDDAYNPLIIRWRGKVYRTNPNADWGYLGHAEPGDVDSEGIPYFEEV